MNIPFRHEEMMVSGIPLDPVAERLVSLGVISLIEADAAQSIAKRRGLPLADILVARYGIAQRLVIATQAEILGCSVVDPTVEAPDPRLVAKFGLTTGMAKRLLPWKRVGHEVIILVCQPHIFEENLSVLINIFGPVRMALTTQTQFDQAITDNFGMTLAQAAENRTPTDLSCRNWKPDLALRIGLATALALAAIAFWQPVLVFAALTCLGVGFLILNSLLKIAVLLVYRRREKNVRHPTPETLPKFSLLIPLHDETAIADHLLARLQAIDYPCELLDVCLVLEASDKTTRHAIGQATLPTWMRTLVVPDGQLKTKPRAMNYALGFTHGSIIGIYDAEDAPASNQLHQVAAHFAQCADDVVCLQGTLDYYNAGSSWLTRCFTMEYASWFRVVLPGLAKMGFVVPLGGTTLFFKRDVLEELGAWDAHNVTEDADLGVRLARFGYRTEFIHTVTLEEANGRFWPWVKQRSRWLKGYAITYGVHMRKPLQLYDEIGALRFFGLQMLFAGTLMPFLLAPILLSFWLIPFGLPHPLVGVVPMQLIWVLGALFFTSELLNISIAVIAVRRAGKGWLAKWAPTLQLYFPLATIAAYKGLLELTWKPFYWDKTAHGIFKVGRPAPPPLQRRASVGSQMPR